VDTARICPFIRSRRVKSIEAKQSERIERTKSILKPLFSISPRVPNNSQFRRSKVKSTSSDLDSSKSANSQLDPYNDLTKATTSQQTTAPILQVADFEGNAPLDPFNKKKQQYVS
jgi:hypothetical protein